MAYLSPPHHPAAAQSLFSIASQFTLQFLYLNLSAHFLPFLCLLKEVGCCFWAWRWRRNLSSRGLRQLAPTLFLSALFPVCAAAWAVARLRHLFYRFRSFFFPCYGARFFGRDARRICFLTWISFWRPWAFGAALVFLCSETTACPQGRNFPV